MRHQIDSLRSISKGGRQSSSNRSAFLAADAGLGKGLEWAASVSSKSAVKTELGKYDGHLKGGKLLRNSVEPISVFAVANSWGN